MNIKALTIFIAVALLTSCGVSKEVLQKIQANKKETIELPIDYANTFPTATFEQWDKDYNYYECYLTADILKTQMGLAFYNNGVQIWTCIPSARTHIQLDTSTMIRDNKVLVGDWRCVSNRRISYIDSVVYSNKKIYRTSRLINNDKDADAFLSMTDTRFDLYGAEKEGSKYKHIISKNYQIENSRFLMLYGISKASPAISFIGIDKEKRMIINSFWVQERKVKGVYITYEAVMMQMIYKKTK